jgi:hypothetical protein
MRRALTRVSVIAPVIGVLLLMSPYPSRHSPLVPRVHAEEGCSVATLNGAYGFYRTGTTSVGPLASVGIATYDGHGITATRQTIRKNGITTQDLFTGPTQVASYEVDPDCAGRLLNPDGSAFSHFVVVDGGKEFFGLSLSPGNSVNVVWKKITRDKD